MDIVKLLTDPSAWILAGIFIVSMFLYQVIRDYLKPHMDKIPEANITLPIVIALILAVIFGIVLKQNIAVIFAVVLAYGLIIENKDVIDKYETEIQDKIQSK